ncbi:hypothetical protein A0H81_05083 [Grifola frondosa]|uniref:Uncharacterized protein n=1 Tax=Grifola frondosa TaxID=5627 RepID=A0A1C7MEX1_GRIFR|nr:hypothetical protein A0H81_05083 [Grifola frondosa]
MIVDKEHALPASELSTILESETSGISKYVPSLDNSECLEENGSQFLDLPLLRSDAETCRSGAHTPLSRDTSAFDLSMSKLSTEVLEAMSEGGTTGGWLSGVVVDELHDATEYTLRQDTSFNLGALDPDLAALLSPHRLGSAEPALLVAIDVLPPPSTSSPVSPSTSAPHIALSTPSSSGNRSSASRSSSIHRTGSPNIAGPSNLSLSPRPSLVSDRPSLPRSARNPPSYALTHASSARPASRSPERASSGSGGRRSQSRLRRSPSSRSIEASGVPETRKPATSRLVTPGRPPLLMPQTKTSRPPLHHPNSTPTSLWEGSFVSPSSRAPSVAGTASSRLQDPRPSLDSGVDRQRPAWMRTRQRSVSVNEGRPSLQPASMRPAADLGPRTAKVFAAAGLLDSDKDPSITRPGSRFGSSRSSFERDSRSRCAPSRMALSDAGSSSSWTRNGTMSHAIGISEGASMHGGRVCRLLALLSQAPPRLRRRCRLDRCTSTCRQSCNYCRRGMQWRLALC